MFSVKEFADFLGKVAERVEAEELAKHRALEKGAKIIEKRAKAIIGHYQTNTGPFDPWQPLADSTLAEKEALGYAPPDNPGLRNGDMRASIEHTIRGNEAHIGSNDDKMVWFELGTRKQPPRSVLGAAAFQTGAQAARVVGMDLAATWFPPMRGNWRPNLPHFGSTALSSGGGGTIVGTLEGAEDDGIEFLGEIAAGLLF